MSDRFNVHTCPSLIEVIRDMVSLIEQGDSLLDASKKCNVPFNVAARWARLGKNGTYPYSALRKSLKNKSKS